MRVKVIVKATEKTEAGELPSEALFAEMGRFNELLAEAGVLMAGDGLHPTSRGVRIAFPGGTVTDGPFTETKELIAGFWLWQVGSMDEAIDWIRRSPFGSMAEGEANAIEIRPLYEEADFGEAFTPELREREAAVRERVARGTAG